MRNYDRYRIGDREFEGKSDFAGKRGEKRKKKLVVEDNTIYEIDLECMECLEKIKNI